MGRRTSKRVLTTSLSYTHAIACGARGRVRLALVRAESAQTSLLICEREALLTGRTPAAHLAHLVLPTSLREKNDLVHPRSHRLCLLPGGLDSPVSEHFRGECPHERLEGPDMSTQTSYQRRARSPSTVPCTNRCNAVPAKIAAARSASRRPLKKTRHAMPGGTEASTTAQTKRMHRRRLRQPRLQCQRRRRLGAK